MAHVERRIPLHLYNNDWFSNPVVGSVWSHDRRSRGMQKHWTLHNQAAVCCDACVSCSQYSGSNHHKLVHVILAERPSQSRHRVAIRFLFVKDDEALDSSLMLLVSDIISYVWNVNRTWEEKCCQFTLQLCFRRVFQRVAVYWKCQDVGRLSKFECNMSRKYFPGNSGILY